MIHSPALRVGIIGSNYGLAHIAPLRAAGATVVALAGRDPSKTATLAAQHQIALATTDIDQLCQAVDAVVIASPDGLHHQHVLQVLGHGRHILCEKPLTRTASDAEALVAAAAQAKVVCATAFAYRHIGVLRQLHNWLRQRPAPHWLSISVANSFASAEGFNHHRDGPLMGQSGDFGGVSHLLDASLWLMAGEPRWLQALLVGRPCHSIGLQLMLNHGGVVHLNQFVGHEPGIHGHWQLAGEGWEVRFNAAYLPGLHSWRLGPIQCWQQGQWQPLAPQVEAGPSQAEPWFEGNLGTARAFLAAIGGQPQHRDDLVSFADAARVQRLFAAAIASEQQGQRIWLAPQP